MTQADPTLASGISGTSQRTTLNSAFGAVNSTHKGSARPSYVQAGMHWIDESANPLWAVYMYDGTDDILVGEFNVTTNKYTPANAQLIDGSTNFAVATGSSNAYAVSVDASIASLTAGLPVAVMANHANTGAITLDANATGAVAVKKNGNQDLAENDILEDQIFVVRHDGIYWQLISPVANVAPLATETVAGLVEKATSVEYLAGTADKYPDAAGVAAAIAALPKCNVIATSNITSAVAQVDFTNLPGNYEHIIAILDTITFSTDGAHMQARCSTDNGASYDNGAGKYAYGHVQAGTTGANDVSDTELQLNYTNGTGNASGETYSSVLLICGLSSTSSYKAFMNLFALLTTITQAVPGYTGGFYKSLSAVSAIRFFPSGGNFTGGRITLIGVNAA